MQRLLPLFFIVFIFFTLFVSFTSTVNAANPQDVFYKQNVNSLNDMKQKEEACAADNNGKPCISGLSAGSFTIDALIYNLTNKIGCTDITNCESKLTALGNVTNVIGEVYSNPAASGIAYVHDTLNNAGFVKPAYAQGIGFSALSTFLPFWKVTRNIAYSIIIIVMLIIGFMIDIMYFSMAILITLLVTGAGGRIGGADVTNLQSAYLNADLGGLINGVFWAGVVNNLGVIELTTGAGVVGIIAAIVTHVATLPVIATGGGVILLFIFGGFLFTLVRLFFLLLNSYIQLLISVILGPFILLH